jgi:hypothetical protein
MRGGLKQEFKKRIQLSAGRSQPGIERATEALECMRDPEKSSCNRVHRYTERRATPAA